MFNRFTLTLAGAALALVTAWGYGHYQYRQGVADTTTAARLAAFDKYQADVERMASVSWELHNIITELQHAKPTVITQYRERVVQAPLPDACRIDAERLRGIQSASKAAAAVR